MLINHQCKGACGWLASDEDLDTSKEKRRTHVKHFLELVRDVKKREEIFVCYARTGDTAGVWECVLSITSRGKARQDLLPRNRCQDAGVVETAGQCRYCS
mmetsp:Transcript_12545/g.50218  ORF Transcript_12545/g.50218 Transcript_12545/m.50218 type:complete len:100 (-) Transcript_12545:129-428(-)